MGNHIMERLIAIKEKNPLLSDIRGRGLMIAIEMVGKSQLVYERLLARGFIVCKRPNCEVLRLDPALTVPKETIDEFLNTFEDIIQEL